MFQIALLYWLIRRPSVLLVVSSYLVSLFILETHANYGFLGILILALYLVVTSLRNFSLFIFFFYQSDILRLSSKATAFSLRWTGGRLDGQIFLFQFQSRCRKRNCVLNLFLCYVHVTL